MYRPHDVVADAGSVGAKSNTGETVGHLQEEERTMKEQTSKRRSLFPIGALAAAMVMLLAVACAGDDDETTTQTQQQPAAAEQPAAAAAPSRRSS